MSEVNIPPFYVGQKVVALKSCPEISKGSIVTVAECFLSTCRCKRWVVAVLETVSTEDRSICGKCAMEMSHPGIFYRVGGAEYFAPIHESFQSITLEKVLEQETKLVGAN